MIPRCAVWLPLATSQVQAVRFTDLRCFIPAAFYDRILHEDRLALPYRRDYDPRIVATLNMMPCAGETWFR